MVQLWKGVQNKNTLNDIIEIRFRFFKSDFKTQNISKSELDIDHIKHHKTYKKSNFWYIIHDFCPRSDSMICTSHSDLGDPRSGKKYGSAKELNIGDWSILIGFKFKSHSKYYFEPNRCLYLHMHCSIIFGLDKYHTHCRKCCICCVASQIIISAISILRVGWYKFYRWVPPEILHLEEVFLSYLIPPFHDERKWGGNSHNMEEISILSRKWQDGANKTNILAEFTWMSTRWPHTSVCKLA